MLRLTLFGSFALTGPEGADIPVTSRKARALLAYLALSPRQTRSREEIMALLWSDRGEAQARGSLRQVLSGLRKELGDVLKADNDKVALDAARIALDERRDGELLAGFHLNDPAFEEWLRDERLRLESDVAGGEADDCFDDPDVAVLPFDTLPDDTEKQAFSDGITEDIVTELTRFKTFVTYAPWSSFAYDCDEKTTEEIGQELEVDYLVEGSVRHAGGRVRITAMLFDMETTNHVWVQRYDRDLADVFAVQEEVAREVSTEVAIRIEADACALAAGRAPGDRTALDYVMLGEKAQQRDWNAEDAARLYERAIAIDPGCARAHANLANWHGHSPLTLFVTEEAARDKVRDFGEEALTHGPGDAVVLALMADAYAAVGEYELARQCLDKAIHINPNHHAVMSFAASTLPWLGDVAGALEWLARYQRHDPLWQTAAMEVSFEVLYMAGQFDDAVAAIARLSDAPLYMLPLAAAAHAQAGRPEEAEALRQRYEADLPEGQSFATHVLPAARMCTDAKLVQLWTDGFKKAGFEV